MKKSFLFSLFIFSILIAWGQSNQTLDGYYSELRKSFVADNALKTVAFVEQRWRLAGNAGFNESIFYVEKLLKEAGYQKEVNGENDEPLTYRIETRKMVHPTWEPVSASITLKGDKKPLLDFTTNRNMLAINSASTSADGLTTQIINVGKGTSADFQGKNVTGKIVFAESGADNFYRNAMHAGAAGVLAYSMPGYTQPERYTNSIQFQRIGYTNKESQKWAILLSFEVKEKLKAALQKGPVYATVKIQTKIYESDELTIIANAKGSQLPEERFVFSAHVQEPGANDNATGVGTLAEMARVTAALIKENKFNPKRTITFLWGDEIISTARYIKDDIKRAKGIKWGLSLDMVGEDISKTGGSFLIEKMPDPSAIWTRGNDKHTEWGGTELKESQMFPHYFNDLLLNRCKQQSKENGWIVNTNPFEGGSDHTPFLEAKIPGLLMWHFTDVFYHTDNDRLNKVSAEEMKNVGVSALATAFTLASADESTTLFLIDELKENALKRLRTEYDLSKEAIVKGSGFKKEQHILDVWALWYKEAIGKMTDISVAGSSEKITLKIMEAKLSIDQTAKNLNKILEQ